MYATNDRVVVFIGHDHDWITNLYDAEERRKGRDYIQCLLEFQIIPAKPNCDGDDKKSGCNLLWDVQQIAPQSR